MQVQMLVSAIYNIYIMRMSHFFNRKIEKEREEKEREKKRETS